jgi:hypothetical protein
MRMRCPNDPLGPKDTVIVHRSIPGDHEEDSPQCWCGPFVYTGGELLGRTPEEIMAEVEQRERAAERGN